MSSYSTKARTKNLLKTLSTDLSDGPQYRTHLWVAFEVLTTLFTFAKTYATRAPITLFPVPSSNTMDRGVGSVFGVVGPKIF